MRAGWCVKVESLQALMARSRDGMQARLGLKAWNGQGQEERGRGGEGRGSGHSAKVEGGEGVSKDVTKEKQLPPSERLAREGNNENLEYLARGDNTRIESWTL